MDKKTHRPAGKNDKTTLNVVIPMEVEKNKNGELEIQDWKTLEDIAKTIEEGYIEIKAGSYTIEKDGTRKMLSEDQTIRKNSKTVKNTKSVHRGRPAKTEENEREA